MEEGRRAIVTGNVNAKVGDERIDKVPDKRGVPGYPANGSLEHISSERETFQANTLPMQYP